MLNDSSLIAMINLKFSPFNNLDIISIIKDQDTWANFAKVSKVPVSYKRQRLRDYHDL